MLNVTTTIKAAVLQIILENHELCKYAIMSLYIHIIVDLNKQNRLKPTYIRCFAKKTDNSLFCHRDIPSVNK